MLLSHHNYEGEQKTPRWLEQISAKCHLTRCGRHSASDGNRIFRKIIIRHALQGVATCNVIWKLIINSTLKSSFFLLTLEIQKVHNWALMVILAASSNLNSYMLKCQDQKQKRLTILHGSCIHKIYINCTYQ